MPTADGFPALQMEHKACYSACWRVSTENPAVEQVPHAKHARPMSPALQQVHKLTADVLLLCRRSTTPCCSRC